MGSVEKYSFLTGGAVSDYGLRDDRGATTSASCDREESL